MAGAGGASQRDHILEACRQTGKTPEELGYPEISLEDEEMPIPEDGLYLWFFFQELSGGRGNNGFGPTALSWSDMEAWARLTKSSLCAAWMRPFWPPTPKKRKDTTKTRASNDRRHNDGRH